MNCRHWLWFHRPAPKLLTKDEAYGITVDIAKLPPAILVRDSCTKLGKRDRGASISDRGNVIGPRQRDSPQGGRKYSRDRSEQQPAASAARVSRSARQTQRMFGDD